MDENNGLEPAVPLEDPECETCGRDDVDLTKVRTNTWYCRQHLGLFTANWPIAPQLAPFE